MKKYTLKEQHSTVLVIEEDVNKIMITTHNNDNKAHMVINRHIFEL